MSRARPSRAGGGRSFAPAPVAVGVEGLAGVVAGAGFLVATFVGSPADRGTAVFLSVIFLLYGVALLAMARGLWRGRRWPRTPALLTQFFGLVVAWNQRSTLPAVAVVLAVVCIGTAVALLSLVQRSGGSAAER